MIVLYFQVDFHHLKYPLNRRTFIPASLAFSYIYYHYYFIFIFFIFFMFFILEPTVCLVRILCCFTISLNSLIFTRNKKEIRKKKKIGDFLMRQPKARKRCCQVSFELVGTQAASF